MDNYRIIFWNSKDKANSQLNFLNLMNFSNPAESQHFNSILNFIF